jgi:hypothetical protein
MTPQGANDDAERCVALDEQTMVRLLKAQPAARVRFATKLHCVAVGVAASIGRACRSREKCIWCGGRLVVLSNDAYKYCERCGERW